VDVGHGHGHARAGRRDGAAVVAVHISLGRDGIVHIFIRRFAPLSGMPVLSAAACMPDSAAPLASSPSLRNSPWCGGQSASITISGLNFGFNTHTASAAVASASCRTTAWTSSSTVACMLLALPAVSSLAQDGFGADVRVVLTVNSLAGTASYPLLTFDGALSARSEHDERPWLHPPELSTCCMLHAVDRCHGLINNKR
jgi:hypothetical protein